MTVVHRPDDARIRQRQIQALLDAGHVVTYAAPFADWGVDRRDGRHAGLTEIDLPRAVGRHRLAAARAGRRVLHRYGAGADVVLVHDPELVPGLLGLRVRAGVPVRIWDVHEDTAAALSMKQWLPVSARPALAGAVRQLEHTAERRVRLLLAEDGYRERFGLSHPVVPNSTPVPATVRPPDEPRAVYVGHVTVARGGPELVRVAGELRSAASAVRVEVIGHADEVSADLLDQAMRREDLRWHGFLPNAQALSMVEGSMAGLSLLHDEANYRHSRPTKIVEYMGRGVPVVTTPTPPARDLVERFACGIVVDFGNATAAAAAVQRLADDVPLRHRLATAGHTAALEHFNWTRDGIDFVGHLEDWVEDARAGREQR